MHRAMDIGLYGKLPAHGDFVARNLPPRFVNAWDEWLQGFVGSSQEQLGDDWLNIYLTSPIWRFVFSSGTLDDSAWAGVVLPSVDRVGRYFPFSLVGKVNAGSCLVDLLSGSARWFAALEDLALQGLDGALDAESMFQEMQQLGAPASVEDYVVNTQASDVDPYLLEQRNKHVALNMDFEEQLPSSVNGLMLDWFIQQKFNSYSLWHCTGSERVQPSYLVAQGMPQLQNASAMLAGNWEQCQWAVPYKMVTEPYAEEV